MKKNVYVIENKNDRTNVMGEQTYNSLTEAKSWADCIEEDIDLYNEEVDEDERISKSDIIVSYYDAKGVQRGEWPLF